MTIFPRLGARLGAIYSCVRDARLQMSPRRAERYCISGSFQTRGKVARGLIFDELGKGPRP